MDTTQNDKNLQQLANKKTLGPQNQLTKSPPVSIKNAGIWPQRDLQVGEKQTMKKQGVEKAQGKNKKRNKKRKSKLTKQIEGKGLKTKQKLQGLKKPRGHKSKDDQFGPSHFGPLSNEYWYLTSTIGKLDLKKKLNNGIGFNGQPLKQNGLLGKQGRPAKDAYGGSFSLGSDPRVASAQPTFQDLINKRALTNLFSTNEQLFDTPIQPFSSSPLGLLQRASSTQISFSNQQQPLIRSHSLFQKTDENYWIKRQDKFEREKQLLLILDDMLEQIKQFSLEHKIVDFVKISENLSHYNLSPKICIRLWEALKKKLKDLYKRENEFQSLCRNEVNVDFWTETTLMFKQRIKYYEQALHQMSIQKAIVQKSSQDNPIYEFQRQELKFSNMIESYFQLFEEPNKLVSVMQDLQQQINDSQLIEQGFKQEALTNDVDMQSQEEIDQLLNELLTQIDNLEEERTKEVLSKGNQQLPRTLNSGDEAYNPPWTTMELASLIRGIFRFGENEWNELLEDIEVHPQRTANQVALKWRQVKQLMTQDIKKATAQTNGTKIVTKHEWMVAALELLEKVAPNKRDSETPDMLYDALYIDPSKLTPYQQSQLEYQRQQQLKSQDLQSAGPKKNKLAKGNTLDITGKLEQALAQVAKLSSSALASNEETKENGEKKADQQEIQKGLIDLKEYAPHILDQVNMRMNRSQSLGATPIANGATAANGLQGANKDFEFVKIIQNLYQEQCSQDTLKLWNQQFANPMNTQRLYSSISFGNSSLMMQPPQNQIVPKEGPESLGEKQKNYNQVINRRREQQNSLGLTQSLSHQPQFPAGSEFQKPLQKPFNDTLNLKKLLLQNDMQRKQQQLTQKPLVPTPELTVNNVNPEPSVIKPNTLKYIAPQCVQKDGANSPKMERKGSFGSGSSVFSKPSISHSRQVQNGTIINNFYINNNISIAPYQSNFFAATNTLSPPVNSLLNINKTKSQQQQSSKESIDKPNSSK